MNVFACGYNAANQCGNLPHTGSTLPVILAAVGVLLAAAGITAYRALRLLDASWES